MSTKHFDVTCLRELCLSTYLILLQVKTTEAFFDVYSHSIPSWLFAWLVACSFDRSSDMMLWRN